MSFKGFTKKVIGELLNDTGKHPYNLLLSIADFDKDGKQDVLVGPRNGRMVWYKNLGDGNSFSPVEIDRVENIDVGGAIYDIDGDGYPDVIAGGDYLSFKLHWWQNPGKTGGEWRKHLIVDTGVKQFHDQIAGIVGDVKRPSVFFWNQGGKTLYEAPVPHDPTISPWPGITVLSNDLKEEGLAIADLDGDGQNELIAGTRWFKRTASGWIAHTFAQDYLTTRVCVADLDGDGELELLLAEGDACIYGKPQGGKLAWFKRGEHIEDLWKEHVIEDGMLDPHSLACGDICKNGHIDVFAGEIGLTTGGRPPRILVFENDGNGNFTRHIVDEGTGTHEAKIADMRGLGVLDIIGKPLHGPEKWNVHIWYNNLAPAK